MTDVSPDFVGRVERLSLRPTAENALMPLFEAVSNSLHAVNDRYGADAPAKARIKVTIVRDSFEDEKSPVTGFIVEDNGIGLDDKNYGSYRRLDSRHKMHRGGKGIGRLGWLKVFSRIEVDSTFQDGETQNKRSFNFQLTETNQIADCPPHAECPAGGGTRVTMRDYIASFMNKCPADPDTILQRLAQHFLNVIVAENPIALMIEDGSLNRNLAKHVLEHVRANNLDPIQLHPEYHREPLDFVIRHLRISRKFKPVRGFNRMLMFGNDGSANEQNIQLVAGFWRRLNLAVGRLGPGISADATEWGKAGFFRGPEWRKLSGGRCFRRNWSVRSSSNLSCRISPSGAAVRHRS